MRVLLFQGVSLVSWAIRWQTRSRYSHVGIQLRDGSVIEAWHKGGVQHVPSISTLHTPGTNVDFYKLPSNLPFDEDAADEWILRQVGKGYDFGTIARFLSRRDERADNKFICSELGFIYVQKGGVDLLHGIPSHMSPRDVALSPYLFLDKTEVTT